MSYMMNTTIESVSQAPMTQPEMMAVIDHWPCLAVYMLMMVDISPMAELVSVGLGASDRFWDWFSLGPHLHNSVTFDPVVIVLALPPQPPEAG